MNTASGNRGLALGAGAVGIAGALAVEATLLVTRMYRVEKEGERREKYRERALLRRARSDSQRGRVDIAVLEPELPDDTNTELDSQLLDDARAICLKHSFSGLKRRELCLCFVFFFLQELIPNDNLDRYGMHSDLSLMSSSSTGAGGGG